MTSTNYSNPSQANESFACDAVGNRISSHLSNTYGYQPNNKLTSTQTASLSYDSNGNMLSKSDSTGYWIYGWDYGNRLTSVRKRNKTVRYQYDALGRRVSRHGKSVGATAKYTYDGLDVLMDDGSEGIVKYQNGLGIDNKLKLNANGTAKYFLQDHLGSTTALTDSSGNVLEQTNYDSFGNATSNLSTRYQYTGREFDEFTGLFYYRARWYDSKLGRFISEDPVGFVGGINLFAYVKNNPLFYKDPMGHNPCVAAYAATGAVIGAVIGGGVGLVGVVGGGVAVVVTEPAGLALGAAAGGFAGAAVGSLLCDTAPYAKNPPTSKTEKKCDSKPKSNPSPNASPTPNPMPFPSPTPSGNKGKWTCLVRCNIEKSADASPDCPDSIQEYGHGNTRSDAEYNGEQACKARLRDIANGRKLGCYTRHCHPIQCWQN